jgi:Na+-driven multidrug efflux pump
MKRVRQSYWLIGGIGAIWGVICLIVVGFGLGTPLLHLFDIKSGTDKFNTAKYLLWIVLAGLPIFGAQMGGMILFQGTNQWWRASICGIMQGVICNFTISFMMMGIAIATNSIYVFFWNTFVVLAAAVIIVVAWSAIYMYKHYKDPPQTSIPREYLERLGYTAHSL